MRLISLVILSFSIAVAMAHGQTLPSPVSSEQVARLFDYSGHLEMQDVTNSAQQRTPGIIWSENYLAADDQLAVTSITLAQGKSLLTDALSQQYQEASSREIKLPDGQLMPKLAEPITLANGAKGFAYVSGFGPGGSSYEATVTSPDGAFDASITVAFSSSINADKIQSLQAHYDELAKRRNGNLLELLRTALTNVYPEIARSYTDLRKVQAGSTPQNHGPNPLPPVTSTPPAQGIRDMSTPSNLPPTMETKAPGNTLGILATVLLVLLAIGAVFVWRKRP